MTSQAGGAPVLTVSGLNVRIAAQPVVSGLDLELAPGSVTALVGRSGSGKSLTARALAGLLPAGAAASGSARLTGDPPVELLGTPERRMRRLRGSALGYVFQESRASLNPTVSVGRHLRETVRAHGVPRRSRRTTVLEALRRAGIGEPDRVCGAYPFELSGGQVQRVALALGWVLGPRLLVADEVTSALDPVTQAGVLDVLRADAVASGRAVLLITHDLAVAHRWADRVAVLAEPGGQPGARRIVESGPAEQLLRAPADPFTAELVRASGLGPRSGARSLVGERG